MKKTIVLALAVVMLFAFTAVAYAGTTSGWAAWNSASPNDAPATPHKGYASNTNKCAVCHAVHKAAPAGEILLRSTVSDACTYCHIDSSTGMAIVGQVIYNGSIAAYDDDTTYAQSFGGGVAHDYSCTNCHSVHGAYTIQGSRSAKILKDWDKAGTIWDHEYSTFALDKWGSSAAIAAELNQNEQVTAWCTGCHPYFVEAYEATISYYGTSATRTTADKTGTFAKNYKSHVMTDAASGYTNGAADLTSGTVVAYTDSTACRSCHNAGTTDSGAGTITASFPHYTPNYYRFMTVGTSTVDASNQNTIGTVDGLCLKCHRNATDGIGITF